MSTERQERKNEIIYSRVTEITPELKTKINLAFEDIVNRFKQKHLS